MRWLPFPPHPVAHSPLASGIPDWPFSESRKPGVLLEGGTALGTCLWSLYSSGELCCPLISGSHSEEETELTPPGQAALM